MCQSTNLLHLSHYHSNKILARPDHYSLLLRILHECWIVAE